MPDDSTETWVEGLAVELYWDGLMSDSTAERDFGTKETAWANAAPWTRGIYRRRVVATLRAARVPSEGMRLAMVKILDGYDGVLTPEQGLMLVDAYLFHAIHEYELQHEQRSNSEDAA